jgi:hypothetical protein
MPTNFSSLHNLKNILSEGLISIQGMEAILNLIYPPPRFNTYLHALNQLFIPPPFRIQCCDVFSLDSMYLPPVETRLFKENSHDLYQVRDIFAIWLCREPEVVTVQQLHIFSLGILRDGAKNVKY